MCYDKEEALQKKIQDWKVTLNTRNFHKGVNVTIRNGNDKYVDMVPGDTVLLIDKFGKPIHTAKVLATEVLNMEQWRYQIEFLLQFESEPNSRDLVGWMKTMDVGYGKNNWGPIVTAVILWI